MTLPAEKEAEPGAGHGSANPAKWVPVLIVVIGCIWASHYVWHTNQNSYGDRDTVVFINFLIWPLIGSAVLVALKTLRSTAIEPEVGLSDPRRLVLIVSVAIYGVAVAYGGFVIPSVIFILFLLPVLGVRNPLIILGVCALVVGVIWLGFSILMSVPVPLWPRGLGF